MLINIWKDKLAFPLSDYPRYKNGSFKSLHITTVVKDKKGIPYYDSIH